MRLPDPQRSRSVLLGTSTFSNPGLENLPAVTNNVSGMERLLTSPRATSLDPDCCTRSMDVRREAIGALLAKAAAEADDLLLIYYASHGLVAPDGELFLASPETDPEPELIRWTAVPFQEIRRTVTSARAKNRVVILDCCFSGRALTAMSGAASLVAGQLDVAGTYTLTSSGVYQTSSAPPGAPHTAFTGELIRILTDGIEDGPEFLTLQAIYEQLLRTMTAKGLPRPQQSNSQTAANLALARNHRHASAGSPAAVPDTARQHEPVGEAMRLRRQAANDGDPDAMADLARHLDQSGDAAQARLWHRKAAESGNVTEMIRLGSHHWVLGQTDEARNWFQRAADTGSAEARTRLRDLDQWLNRSA
jgi:hypothetical protein